jgi:hypothetical protein
MNIRSCQDLKARFDSSSDFFVYSNLNSKDLSCTSMTEHTITTFLRKTFPKKECFVPRVIWGVSSRMIHIPGYPITIQSSSNSGILQKSFSVKIITRYDSKHKVHKIVLSNSQIMFHSLQSWMSIVLLISKLSFSIDFWKLHGLVGDGLLTRGKAQWGEPVSEEVIPKFRKF